MHKTPEEAGPYYILIVYMLKKPQTKPEAASHLIKLEQQATSTQRILMKG